MHILKSWLYKVHDSFEKGFIEKSLPRKTNDTIKKIICYKMALKNLAVTVYIQLSIYIMPSTAIILSVDYDFSEFL